MNAAKQENIKVVVRIRPLSSAEQNKKQSEIIQLTNEQALLIQHPDNGQKSTFTFDHCFPPATRQQEVFEKVGEEVVESVLNGYSGTLLVYGQTGSGKTFTIQGPAVENQTSNDALEGLLQRSVKMIFEKIKTSPSEEKYLLRISYLEIYNEQLRDLLLTDSKGKEKLEIREKKDGSVYVKNLSETVVSDYSETLKLLRKGQKKRVVGKTEMNQESSRSHSIFILTIEKSKNEIISQGKLYLVDLAGSERQSRTQTTGLRFQEATQINLSLTTLGHVISCLSSSQGKGHVPYRDSQLTRLLQDALGGNSKTVMVANVSPAAFNYDETMSTLRYAWRTKSIKNKPQVNVQDPKDAMVLAFQDEIKRLKEALEQNTEIEEDENTEIQLQKEQERILNNAQLGEDEKQKLLETLDSKYKALEEEQSKKNQLQLRLQELTQQLLQGQNRKTLEKQNIKKKEKSIAVKDDLEMSSNKQQIALLDTDSPLKQQSKALTEQLKAEWETWQSLKEDLKIQKENWEWEKKELNEKIAQSVSELKLKNSIVDRFVPVEYLEWIESVSEWTGEEWIIPYKEYLLNLPDEDLGDEKSEYYFNEGVSVFPESYFLV